MGDIAALKALAEAVEAGREATVAMNEFPVCELRRLISYEPETGNLFWKERVSQRVKAGHPALAAKKQSGHLHGFVKGVQLQAHRVAWAIYHGEWPRSMLDHVNGIRSDNRIANLREVTARTNPKNRRPNAQKSSDLPHGVSVKSNGRFFAQIQVGRKNIHLGYFATADEARAAYCEAASKLGFHPNHGKTIIRALIAQAEGDK